MMLKYTHTVLAVLVITVFSIPASVHALTGKVIKKKYYERYMKLSNGQTFGPYTSLSKFFTSRDKKKWAFVFSTSRTERKFYIQTSDDKQIGPFFNVLYFHIDITDKGCLFAYSIFREKKQQWYIHYPDQKTAGPFTASPVLKYNRNSNFWIYSHVEKKNQKLIYHIKVKGKPVFGPFDRVRSPVISKDGSQWAFTFEKSKKMYVHFSNGRILGPYRHIFGPSFSDNGKQWAIKFMERKSVGSSPVSLRFSDEKVFSSGRYYGIKWPRFSNDNKRYGFAGRTFGGWEVILSTREKFGVFKYAYPPDFGPGNLWAFVYRRNNMHYVQFSSGKTIGPYKAVPVVIFKENGKEADLRFNAYRNGKIVQTFQRITVP